MKKRKTVVLAMVLLCFFSIISARITFNSATTTEHCAIHCLPIDAPVVFNSSDGTIGALNEFLNLRTERAAHENGDIVLTTYFTYECQYPSFTISSDTSSRILCIKIPKSQITEFNHELAARYICENCLYEIEQNNPSGNYLFLVNDGEKLYVKCFDDANQRFSIMGNSFVVCRTRSSNRIIKMILGEEHSCGLSSMYNSSKQDDEKLGKTSLE